MQCIQIHFIVLVFFLHLQRAADTLNYDFNLNEQKHNRDKTLFLSIKKNKILKPNTIQYT